MTQAGGRSGRRREAGRRPVRVAALLVLAGALAGCATARPAVPGATPSRSVQPSASEAPARPASPAPSHAGGFALTLETQDAGLAAALAAEAVLPTSAHHRWVAAEYERLGVLDLAYEHLSTAIAQNPHDAAAYDARARLWRRWGFARLGLSDVYAAARLAPKSAVIANTVGTLLSAAGEPRAARDWFAKAVKLEPQAAYALNNLCYADLLLGQTSAVAECQRAVTLVPTSRVAHNNLGLAYAAVGRMDRAQAEFESDAEHADAAYNLGVAYLGTGQFDRAAKAFAEARVARPTFTLAERREKQALAAEAGAGESR